MVTVNICFIIVYVLFSVLSKLLSSPITRMYASSVDFPLLDGRVVEILMRWPVVPINYIILKRF